MCGITGYISSENRLDGNKMIYSLAHRGPDNIGEFEETNLGNNVFLGHSRLSIIDLRECGNQPMSTPDGNICIVYNGEVYNFEYLKKKHLIEYKFRSRTDTEVILYLYEKYGIDFLKELNGDFAFSIYDRRSFKLYLVRDRLGVKPLYYYFVDRTFIFGSEIKAIMASDLPFTLSERNLHNFFVFKYVPGDETLIKNIYRVKPGHYLEYDISNNRLHIKKYWELNKCEEYDDLSYPESKEILNNLLKDAVTKRLISDVPVGTFLSGGLDSSTISFFLKNNPHIKHYCAKKSNIDLKREGTSSDFYFAKKLSNEWKLNLYPIQIGSNVLTLDNLKKTVYYSDDLIADGSQIASYLITRESSKTAKVMLSGMGGDELFFGYASHLITLLSLYMDRLPKYVSYSLSRFLRSLWQGKGHFKSFKRYLHKLGKYYAYPQYRYGIYSIVGDFENSLSVYNYDDEDTANYFVNYFPDGRDPFESLNYFEIDNFLVKNLHYLDRMCMANSVEGRVPFLDHRLVEFAFSLNRSYKLSRFGKNKKILKDAFESKLPRYIIKRKKAGFGLPLRSIFSSQRNVEQLMDKKFFANFDGFLPVNIERIINNHLVGREDNSALIYALISFQEWFKCFFNKK